VLTAVTFPDPPVPGDERHRAEEYAPHNGHADLLREQIDGPVGE
jgi:hypothetical protein